jgi:hypothetical protein
MVIYKTAFPKEASSLDEKLTYKLFFCVVIMATMRA